jgi:hypothetical protein
MTARAIDPPEVQYVDGVNIRDLKFHHCGTLHLKPTKPNLSRDDLCHPNHRHAVLPANPARSYWMVSD